MNIVLVGAPASGKGTQAKKLANEFNLLHISTGALLRKIISEQSELSNKVKEYVQNGKLVPDNLVIEVLNDHLKTINTQQGILLDGFPRTLFQAEQLDKILNIDFAFEIDISLDVAISRVIDRYVCSGCGAGYIKSQFNKDICDKCGMPLIKRIDDTTETVTERYNDYLLVKNVIINHYKKSNKYYHIDGEKESNEVFNQICGVVKQNDLFKN